MVRIENVTKIYEQKDILNEKNVYATFFLISLVFCLILLILAGASEEAEQKEEKEQKCRGGKKRKRVTHPVAKRQQYASP